MECMGYINAIADVDGAGKGAIDINSMTLRRMPAYSIIEINGKNG
jgi:hypothetical protein